MGQCGSLLRQTVWLCGVFPNPDLPSWGTQCIGESSRESSSKCGPKARCGEWVGSGRILWPQASSRGLL